MLMLLCLGFQGPSDLLTFCHAGRQSYKVLPSGVGKSYTDLQFRWPVALQYGTSIIHTLCSWLA